MRKALALVRLAGLVVSINCQNCTEGDVRLRGGTEFAGRVEVCANETWGTICDRGWDHTDARVICNQLNLNYTDNVTSIGGAACGSACFGEGAGKVFYRDVNCNVTANTNFSDCPSNSVGGGNCANHSNDAGVICAFDTRQFQNMTTKVATATTDPIRISTHEERREVMANTSCLCEEIATYTGTEDPSARSCNDLDINTSQSQVTAITVSVSLGVLAGIMGSAAVVSCSIMALRCRNKSGHQKRIHVEDNPAYGTAIVLQSTNTRHPQASGDTLLYEEI